MIRYKHTHWAMLGVCDEEEGRLKRLSVSGSQLDLLRSDSEVLRPSARQLRTPQKLTHVYHTKEKYP